MQGLVELRSDGSENFLVLIAWGGKIGRHADRMGRPVTNCCCTLSSFFGNDIRRGFAVVFREVTSILPCLRVP